ncbi:MAG: cytochrome C assembly protein, partial [Chloroflexi bacterium]
PVVVGNGNPEAQGGFDMSEKMLAAMFVALGAFTILFIDLIWHRIRMGNLEEKVEQLKLEVSM